MSDIALVGLLIAGLVFLVLLGIHIGVALLAVGFAGVWLIRDDMSMAMKLLYMSAYNGVADYIFATIPLFVLMGLLVSISNIGKDTFDVAEALLRRIKGGLGVATVHTRSRTRDGAPRLQNKFRCGHGCRQLRARHDDSAQLAPDYLWRVSGAVDWQIISRRLHPWIFDGDCVCSDDYVHGEIPAAPRIRSRKASLVCRHAH
jgi:hypothetical protein